MDEQTEKWLLGNALKNAIQKYEDITGRVVDSITINRVIAKGSNTRLEVENVKINLREGNQN